MNEPTAFFPDCRFIILPSGTATKLRIAHAVDAPIDRITVEDICKNCRISRSTFYNHFASKYDVFPWLVASIMERTIDAVGQTATWEQGIDSYLSALDKEIEFLRFCARECSPCPALLAHRMQALGTTLQQKGIRMDSRLGALISHYAESEMSLCLKWLDGSIGLAHDELLGLFVESVPARLYRLMEQKRAQAFASETTGGPALREPAFKGGDTVRRRQSAARRYAIG